MNKIFIAMVLSFPLLASAQTAAINGGVAVPITASPATSTTLGVTQPDGVTILVNGAGGTSVAPVTGIRKGNGAGAADTAGVAGTDYVSPSGLNSATTASAIDTTIKTQTGCSTAGYVWSPASNTCVTGSGGAPTGSASGDLSGSYPSPTVTGYNGTTIYNPALNNFTITIPTTTSNVATPGGDSNVRIGQGAGASLAGGRETVIMGARACGNFLGTSGASAGSAENGLGVCIGSLAGASMVSGYNFNLIGQKAGENITTANQTIAIGSHSADTVLNDNNGIYIGNAIGQTGGPGSATNTGNVFIGYAGINGTAGNKNFDVGIGSQFLQSCSTCSYVVGLGFGVAGKLTTGQFDTIIGANGAGSGLIAGNHDVIIGNYTMQNADTSSDTVVGDQVGNGVTGGGNHYFFGNNVATIPGTYNNVTAFGVQALSNGSITGVTYTNMTCLGSYTCDYSTGTAGFITAVGQGTGAAAGVSNVITLGTGNGGVQCPTSYSFCLNGVPVLNLSNDSPIVPVTTLVAGNTVLGAPANLTTLTANYTPSYMGGGLTAGTVSNWKICQTAGNSFSFTFPGQYVLPQGNMITPAAGTCVSETFESFDGSSFTQTNASQAPSITTLLAGNPIYSAPLYTTTLTANYSPSLNTTVALGYSETFRVCNSTGNSFSFAFPIPFHLTGGGTGGTITPAAATCTIATFTSFDGATFDQISGSVGVTP